MFKFFKKQPEKKPYFVNIPAEHVLKVRQLHDDHLKQVYGPNSSWMETHYNLWTFLAKIIPETQTGSWTLTYPTAITAKVTRDDTEN